MRKIAEIPFRELYDIINRHSGYYDHPLSGTCWYKNEYCWFTWEYDSKVVEIFEMTVTEKLKRHFQEQLFRICVGNHTKWKNRKRQSYFYWRKPKWLHELMFKLYYKLN